MAPGPVPEEEVEEEEEEGGRRGPEGGPLPDTGLEPCSELLM